MNEIVKGDFFSPVPDKAKEKRYADWKGMNRFFAELKRRHVYRVAIAYGVVAWLLIQVATQVFPFFEVSNFVVRVVVAASVLGFPVALVIAWAFDTRRPQARRRCYA
jgi:uncharacterized membrane protein YedE/YeeE